MTTRTKTKKKKVSGLDHASGHKRLAAAVRKLARSVGWDAGEEYYTGEPGVENLTQIFKMAGRLDGRKGG